MISNSKDKYSLKNVKDWIKFQYDEVLVNIEKIPFHKLKKWKYDNIQEVLVHESGHFFSIQGIRVATNWGRISSWCQPIINQPEIGILGIIAKNFDGVMHFLLQAKVEPGNINYVQLSPTLQATKSNYNRVHEGQTPEYLEYFLDENKKVIIDQLQSEQGGRFLQKRNRNIIILIEDEIKHNDNFHWVTLDHIKDLLHEDNIINMDTRSVIAGLNINKGNKLSSHYLKQNGELFSLNQLLCWIANQKTKFDLEIKKIPLNKVQDWKITENEIHHNENKYFKIIATDVSIRNREVSHWTQPMVESAQEGLIAFLVKKINGIIHFIVQAKVESGNLDIIELAPTVQCLTGNYREGKESNLPFLNYILNAHEHQKVIDTLQSEEGGRFYREQNRNLIIKVEDDFSNELPDNYKWMTYNQIHTFMMFNNYINIQARSLLAVIKRCDDEIS